MSTKPSIPPRKKKKSKFIDVLRATRFPKHGLRGGQEVPMDIDKINASLDAANKKE